MSTDNNHRLAVATERTGLLVAEQLRPLLGRHAMNDTDLARVLHVDKSKLSRQMRGRQPWYVTDITNLASFFEVDVAYFVGGEEHPVPTCRCCHRPL